MESKGLFQKSGFFQKLKSIKHIEIIIVVILGAVALLIYFSTFSGKTENTAYKSTDTTEYIAMLENKLSNVLGQIKNVGNVSVMITLASGPEYIYATNEEEKTNTNTAGNSTTTSTITTTEPIVISNELVVIKEIMPTVGGVIVVASGAQDTGVKLEILKAIQALLDVPQASIEVLVGK
jgi:stage III sporulation protein AG